MEAGKRSDIRRTYHMVEARRFDRYRYLYRHGAKTQFGATDALPASMSWSRLYDRHPGELRYSP